MSIRFFNMYLQVPIILLAMVEGSLLLFAPYLSAAIMYQDHSFDAVTRTGNLLPTALLFAVIAVASLVAVGLYSTRQRVGLAGIFVRVSAAVANAAAVSALVYYFVPVLRVDRSVLLGMAALGVGLCFLVRVLFERVVEEDLFKRRIAVYGAGNRCRSLVELRRRADTRGFKIVGFMPVDGDEVIAPADKVIARPPDLYQWALENGIDEIVMAMDDRRRGFPMHELLECRLAGIDVLELPSFLERETGKVRLDVLNPSWIIFGDGFRASPTQQFLERTFDVVASLGLLLVALPLMLLAVLGIKLEEGFSAPVLYRQRRVGFRGRVFDVLKFRSMRLDAEKFGAQYAVENDPRVTRIGGFMRKTRIDELPQLLNVLRGEMSFVGPRPERPEFVGELEQRIPYYRERHTVKPGITGWAQLCYPYGSSEKDTIEKLQYDLYYVKNRSLLFDLAILVQTVEVVLWGKGAR
ncbi:MAG: TIGR03013 family XrtA/PEP-CTERM system glycosyltransferase [Steroidobacteraceae bacterium]